MTLNEFIAEMYSIAPLDLAMEYDNVGLLIGTDRDEIKHVLVALDCTLAVAREAVRIKADLVLTHHPMFFHGINRILPNHPDTAAAYLLIRNGIGLYAAHTNLDAASGGVNDVLCDILNIKNATSVPPENIARFGEFEKPIKMSALLMRVNSELNTRARYTGDLDREISKVVIQGGSGSNDIIAMNALGADVFITGEVNHSDAVCAEAIDFNIIVAGHHETECVVLKRLIKSLQSATYGVQYTLAVSGTTPLKISPDQQ